MEVLEIEISGNLCVVGPVPSAKLFVFDLLLRRLFEDWDKEFKRDFIEMIDKKLSRFQQVANLLPRLDIEGFGFPVKDVAVSEIQAIFFFQIDERQQAIPSKLVELHNLEIPPDPDEEPILEVPTPGQDISDWNPPLKTSGSHDIDLLAGLCVAFGAEGAMTLSNKLDRCRLQMLLRQHNRHHEDPEKRREKYLKKYYQEYKKQNQAAFESALGLDFDPASLLKPKQK